MYGDPLYPLNSTRCCEESRDPDIYIYPLYTNRAHIAPARSPCRCAQPQRLPNLNAWLPSDDFNFIYFHPTMSNNYMEEEKQILEAVEVFKTKKTCLLLN